MNECQMCHSEDSTFNRFCKDCWIEMIREAKSAGQDFSEKTQVPR